VLPFLFPGTKMNTSRPAPELLTIGLALAVITFAWTPWTFHGVELKTTALVAGVLVLALLRAARTLGSPGRGWRGALTGLLPRSGAEVLLLAWLALNWCSLLWSPLGEAALERLFEVTLLVAWAWLVMVSIRRPDDIRRLLRWYVAFALAAAAMGLAAFLGWHAALSAGLLEKSHRLMGLVFTRVAVHPFGNPNFLGGYLLLPLGVTLALGLRRRSPVRERVWWLAASGLLLVTVGATQSVSAVLGAGLVVVVTVVHVLNPEARYRAVEVLTGATLLTTLLVGRILYRLGAEGLQALGSGWVTRAYFWRWAVALVREAPVIGWGAGNSFPAIMPVSDADRFAHPGLFGDFTVHCHNEYLEVLVELGVIGLVLFLVFLYLTLRPLGKAYATQERQDTSSQTVGLLAGFLGLSLQACFSVAPRFVEVAAPTWLTIGLMLAWARLEARAERAPTPALLRWRGGWPAGLLVLHVALAGWFGYEFGWLPFRSAWCFRSGVTAQRSAIQAVKDGRAAEADLGFQRAGRAYRCALAGRLPYVDQVRLYKQAGDLEYSQHRYTRAAHLYRRASQLAPGIAPVQLALAAAVARTGEEERNVVLHQELKRTAAIYPSLRRYIANGQAALAFRLREGGKVEAAVCRLNWAIELAPDVVEFHLALAQCYVDLEQPSPAEAVIQAATQRFAGNPQALELLDALKRSLQEDGDHPEKKAEDG